MQMGNILFCGKGQYHKSSLYALMIVAAFINKYIKIFRWGTNINCQIFSINEISNSMTFLLGKDQLIVRQKTIYTKTCLLLQSYISSLCQEPISIYICFYFLYFLFLSLWDTTIFQNCLFLPLSYPTMHFCLKTKTRHY